MFTAKVGSCKIRNFRFIILLKNFEKNLQRFYTLYQNKYLKFSSN